jgi:hypothetical protein
VPYPTALTAWDQQISYESPVALRPPLMLEFGPPTKVQRLFARRESSHVSSHWNEHPACCPADFGEALNHAMAQDPSSKRGEVPQKRPGSICRAHHPLRCDKPALADLYTRNRQRYDQAMDRLEQLISEDPQVRDTYR